MPSVALSTVSSVEIQEYRKDFPGTSAREAQERLEIQQRGVGIVEQLEAAQGSDYAGVWFDNETGEFVVPLKDADNRTSVHDALEEKKVAGDYRTVSAQHSWAQLEAAQDRIDKALFALIEGNLIQTSLDPRTNAVVIEKATATDRAQERRIEGIAKGQGVDVEVRAAGVERFEVAPSSCWFPDCEKPLRGGVEISASSGLADCSAGFKALGNSAGNHFLLTAGHCIYYGGPHWMAFDPSVGRYVGASEEESFPGGDWAKIRVNGKTAEGDNDWWDESGWASRIAYWGTDTYHLIDSESSSYMGQSACHAGRSTGASCGTVNALGVTANYSEGPVYNTTQFGDVCHDGGDSGGPVFAGGTALGLFSGRFLNDPELSACDTTTSEGDARYGTGIYVEITEAADAMGVHIGSRVGAQPVAQTTCVEPGVLCVTGNTSGRQATLHGTVDPNGISTSYHFEYGKTTSYGSSTASFGAGSGWQPSEKTETVTGLRPSTTYHYRLVASNSSGTSYGSDLWFTTPTAAPLATTEGQSDVKAGKGTLHGTVEPGGLSTKYQFEWGKTTSYGSTSPSSPETVGFESKDFPVSAPITGLKGLTTYHYRLKAENAKGTVYGADKSFTTPDWRPAISDLANSAPYVEEGTYVEVGPGKADVSGKINPNGFVTDYHFEWATQEEFDKEEFNNSTPSASVGVGTCTTCEEGIEATIEDLEGDTTYHWRVVGENQEGESTEEGPSFKTPDWGPSQTTTDAATKLSHKGAKLNGTVNPKGLKTTYQFQYVEKTEFDANGYENATTVPASPKEVGSGTSAVKVSERINGLEASTTYRFRVLATNEAGGTNWGNLQFTTRRQGLFFAEEDPVGPEPVELEAPAKQQIWRLPKAFVETTCDASLSGTQYWSSPEFRLRLSPAYSNCGALSNIKPNGCVFEVFPYEETKWEVFDGTFDLSCPEGKAMTATYFPFEFECKLQIPAQEGLETTFENFGTGSGRGVGIDPVTDELKYTVSPEGKICGESGEDGSFSGPWTLSAEFYEAPIGIWVEGAPPGDALYISGKESESESEQPKFSAEGYPRPVQGEQGPSHVFGWSGEKTECASTALDGTLPSASAELSLGAEYGSCTSAGRVTTVTMNSCDYVFALDNAGPPYSGSQAIACAEEGDAVELKVKEFGFTICTVSLGAQTVGAAGYEVLGEGPARHVLVSANGEGLEYSTKGAALCPEGSGSFEDGTFGGGTDLVGME